MASIKFIDLELKSGEMLVEVSIDKHEALQCPNLDEYKGRLYLSRTFVKALLDKFIVLECSECGGSGVYFDVDGPHYIDEDCGKCDGTGKNLEYHKDREF